MKTGTLIAIVLFALVLLGVLIGACGGDSGSGPTPQPKCAISGVNTSQQNSWLTGDMPSPFRRPRGCIFHDRCPFRVKRCEADVPALRRMENGDWVACHRAEELDLSIEVSASG